MSDVVIIRPGCTDFDEENRIQGSLELPLNARGVEQVQDIVRQLVGLPIKALYTSPVEPCRSTAEAIGEGLGVPVKTSDELRNLNQGLWQGLQIDDVRHKYPKVFKQWQDSPETIRPPNGEAVGEAVERIRKALRKPLRKWDVFGVVAGEPLASLIAATVRHGRLEIPEPICRCTAEPRIEVVHANGELALGEDGAVPQDERDPQPAAPRGASHGGNGHLT
jgi:probable phosphoglycerate mutase